MEHLSVHDSERNVLVGCTDKPKVAEMAMGNLRSSGRRTLADISNIPQQPNTSNHNNNPQPTSDTIREHIKQLQKERAALMKLISDKNKIIENGEAEGYKLRVTLQKVREQNMQLAQSNNQMLMDLTSVKDRQKTLKHEIECKNALILAKKLELEETEVCTVAENIDDKNSVPSFKKVQDNDMGKNRRLQTRRQSAMFKVNEPNPIKDTIKIEDVDDDDKTKVNGSNSVPSSSNKESKEGDCKPQEHRKIIVSRPLREAAKKVQSYKEIKVNMKMRRGD